MEVMQSVTSADGKQFYMIHPNKLEPMHYSIEKIAKSTALLQQQCSNCNCSDFSYTIRKSISTYQLSWLVAFPQLMMLVVVADYFQDGVLQLLYHNY